MKVRMIATGPLHIGMAFRIAGDVFSLDADEAKRLAREGIIEILTRGMKKPPAHKMVTEGQTAVKRREPFRGFRR